MHHNTQQVAVLSISSAMGPRETTSAIESLLSNTTAINLPASALIGRFDIMEFNVLNDWFSAELGMSMFFTDELTILVRQMSTCQLLFSNTPRIKNVIDKFKKRFKKPVLSEEECEIILRSYGNANDSRGNASKRLQHLMHTIFDIATGSPDSNVVVFAW